MAQLDILVYPDPHLRVTADPVTDFGADLDRLVDDLVETLHATSGIGLSATQVGDRRAVLVMDLSEDHSEPREYINPVILSKSTPGFVEERCLSIPGVVGNVVRATEVRVRAQDRTGATFERDLSQMHAVCMQHEVDHLNGKLFIDRLNIFRRLWIKARAARQQTGAPGPRVAEPV